MANERNAGRRFDREHGVATQAILFLTDLDADRVGDAGAHATHYEAVPPRDFRELMQHVPGDVVRRSTFVDVGAGMGRALLLASEYPFVRVAGIEVSPALFEVTLANLASSSGFERKTGRIDAYRDDARIWPYPPGDLVAFLFNPFDAQALQATLGAIIHREDPGETWLMYHTPVERILIEDDKNWKLAGETRNGAVFRYG